MAVLDNPQELIAFLGQHLKPKELEKKQNGEVFTPPELIQQKFDQLTLADPEIWSDPSKKFLDPANGIGNYPALAYHRLMKGLAEVIPNEADRKRHILENMLYMCELTKKNVEVSRRLFDPKGMYALQLFQGSYLDLDPMKEWGVEKFDVIFGNPPYNNSHDKKDGQGGSGSRSRLYPAFVTRSLTFLKDTGYLIFLHPAMWRKPGDILHESIFRYQLHYIRCFTKPEGSKLLHATTRVDWYILQKVPPHKPTTIYFDDHTVGDYLLNNETPLLCGHGHGIWEKMYRVITSGRAGPLPVIKQAIANSKCSKMTSKTNVYPLVHSTSTGGVSKISWFSKAHPNQYVPKVVFAEIEMVYPVFDALGKFGTTDNVQSILVSSEAEGHYICRYMSSKLFQYLIGSTKWSNFRTDHTMFPYLPYPKDLPENFTDAYLYAYFELTPEEVERIEADQPKRGLAEFVTREAPEVSVPLALTPALTPAVEPVAQPADVAIMAYLDYKKMKVDDLRTLCKGRNIKGYSGKNKENLIAMLTE